LTVPDYQTLMAPCLIAMADGQPRAARYLRDDVARRLLLTPEDREDRIPSGALLFDSRMHWAITYMAQAGLVRRPRRGFVQITDRGKAVLHSNPERVDNTVLAQFHEFTEFKSRSKATPTDSPQLDGSDAVPPTESIANAVKLAHTVLADDLLDRVRERDPAFLEHLVLRTLTAMGYGGDNGAAEHLGRSGDEGLDGVIRQDTLGLDRIYVQAKRYAENRAVGRPEIQEFVGALQGAQADRGIFITTSRFTPDAHNYAERVQARVILISGFELAQLMIRHNIGVQVKDTYVIKRIDEDFFVEDV
jgi:restriction system protein